MKDSDSNAIGVAGIAAMMLAASSLVALPAFSQETPPSPAEMMDALPAEGAGPPEFRHVVTDEPLDVPLPEGDDLTEAVQQFHQSGMNMLVGDEEAISDGQGLYRRLCAACHLPRGTGRIGPDIVDDEYVYPRVETDVGLFEVIYGGAGGAMQAFGNRMSQDEILRTIAFIRDLREESDGRYPGGPAGE
jgi:cytochrome c-L